VQLIDDPTIAAWAPVGTAAVGSIRLGVRDLLARPASPRRSAPPPRKPTPRMTASVPLSVAYVLQTLAEARDPASIIVEEAPSSRAAMHDHLPILRSETFYTMDSGGLGYGLPAAVGIALAKPEKKVIALIGDGSAMYSIQALWSAAQLRLPITVIVLKNGRYAALQEFAPAFGFAPGGKLAGTELPGIDFVALARAQGCDALSVSRAQDLKRALMTALQGKNPTLLEVDVA